MKQPHKNIRPGIPVDIAAIEAIAKQLPEWFTPDGIKSIRRVFQSQKSFVYDTSKATGGFIIYRADQGKGHIAWLAVAPDLQKKGIGRELLNAASHALLSEGITEVFVSTLGDSVDYPPYEKTRGFYSAIGFKDFQRLKHPDNPAYEEELVLRLDLSSFVPSPAGQEREEKAELLK
jgi:ribosomal protein S18 acetylase RimI-like enzyme